MAKTNFENLRVYRLSEQVTDSIWDVVSTWPSLAKDTVGRQMIRAADSIGANLAEGVGQGSYAANRRFIRIARGSLYETKHWLRRAFQRRLLTAEQIDQLKSEMDKLGPTLNAYLRSISNSCKPAKAAKSPSASITTNH